MVMVFVYGTLRRGENHHALIGDGFFVGQATSERLFLIEHWRSAAEPGGYPAAVESDAPEAEKLRGEIYEIDDATLSILDDYEDYPALYDRRLQPFKLDDGRSLTAFLYCAPKVKHDIGI